MSAKCGQCGFNSNNESMEIDEDFEECESCMDDFCISCMNGQFNCESCLKEEEEGVE